MGMKMVLFFAYVTKKIILELHDNFEALSERIVSGLCEGNSGMTFFHDFFMKNVMYGN